MSLGESVFGCDLTEPYCYICGAPAALHHVIPSSRRNASSIEGCWVFLCPVHHQDPTYGVHSDREFDRRLREQCQRLWMERNDATVDDWRAIFGVNYLTDNPVDVREEYGSKPRKKNHITRVIRRPNQVAF